MEFDVNRITIKILMGKYNFYNFAEKRRERTLLDINICFLLFLKTQVFWVRVQKENKTDPLKGISTSGIQNLYYFTLVTLSLVDLTEQLFN